MGVELQAIVDRLRRESTGLVAIHLARLNLQTGQPLSRLASQLEDDPELVERARLICEQFLRSEKK